jgi:hypothetical protein
MNFRTTIVLLVLLIVVGGYFLFVEQGQQVNYDPIPKADSDESGTVLFDSDKFDATNVEHITIERDDKTVTLDKQGSDWQQTAPINFALNSWQAEQFGSTVAELRWIKQFTPGEDGESTLDQLGLSLPKAKVTLALGGDTPAERSITLGNTLSIGGRGYVMLDDDTSTVYLVNDALHELALKKDPAEWRNKKLAAPQEPQAELVTLTRHGRSIELVKTDGSWALGGSASGRVATAAVAELCQAIDSIYINEFIKDQPTDLTLYGLKPSATVLAIQVPPASADEEDKPTAAPEVTRLHIGAATDPSNEHYFATLSTGKQGDKTGGDVVFTISMKDVEKFDKVVDDLRDPRITVQSATEVRQLSIAQADQATIGLTRSGSKWSFHGDDSPAYAPDQQVVTELIEAITTAEADAFATPPDGAPLVTVNLTAGGRPEPDVLKVYASDKDNRHLVVRNNETIGHLVPTEKLRGVFEPVLSLRQRTVVELAQLRINEIVVQRPDGLALKFWRTLAPLPAPADSQPATSQPAVVVIPDPPGPWQLNEDEPFESAALDALLKALAPLRAEQWRAQPAAFGDELYGLTVSTAEDETAEVRVDAATRHATATGIDSTFVVKQDLLDALKPEFRYRTLLPFAADQIHEVTVARGDRSVRFSKGAEDQYVSQDGEAELDQDAAAGVFDALAGLRVERYVAPLNLEAQDFAAIVTVKTKDDETYILRLVGKEGHSNTAQIEPAHIGPDWFTLSPNQIDKLTAVLGQDER